MRKLMSMLLALCLVLAMVPVDASAEGNPTITIDGKETTYTDLQAAINEAGEGATITLAEDTIYTLTKSLIINKPVTIQGAPGAVIDGTNTTYPVYGDNGASAYCFNYSILVYADDVTIRDVKIIGKTSAIGVGNNDTSKTPYFADDSHKTPLYKGSVPDCDGFTLEKCVVTTAAENGDIGGASLVQVDGANATIVNNVFCDVTSTFATVKIEKDGTTVSENTFANVESTSGVVAENWHYETNTIGDSKEASAYVEDSDDLNAVLQAAENDDIIVLGSNITLTSGLTGITGKKLTIDGNTHTIFFETSAGDLNGVFGNDTTSLGENTKLTVKNLTIANTGEQGAYASIVGFNANGTEITYENCTFNNLYAAVYVNPFHNAPTSGVKLNISSCNYTNTMYGYAIDEYTNGCYQLTNVTFEDNDGTFTEKEPLKNVVHVTTEGKDYVRMFANSYPYENGEGVLEAAVTAAQTNDTLTVYPGDYGGDNITFDGKSLTIKAQYPAYKDGVKADEDKLSKFEGTFNTYDGSNSFNENQTVVIEGIALSGDGLKIGNCNYNSVGNLEVRYCTMECGGNLSTANSYNQYNYFVKTSGDNGQGTDAFASVTVEDNYITGTLAENVTPIQLWRVDKAIVRNNVINVQGGEDHQAINVSKMAEDAEVEITDNDISGTEGGIYVTNWLLNGGKSNGNSWTDDESLTFEGKISVTDNDLNVSATGEGENPVYPIFVGPETATQTDVGGIYDVVGNTNKDEPVEAVIGKRENSQVQLFTATFKDGNVVVGTISGAPTDGSLTITLPEALTKSGYTFGGWNNGKTTTAAGNEAKITEDTTFTAVWNASSIGGGFTEEPEEPALPFTDVKTGDWFYEHVLYVYENNIMAGMSETTFEPLTTLDRAQAVQMLYNLEGQPEVTGEMDFTDVETSDWWSNAVAWASQNGVVAGYEDETFRPERKVTREEFAQMLYNYAEYKGYDLTASADLSKYPDAGKISGWAETAMAWANGNGLINGHDNGMIDPIGTATRAQAASILANFDKNIVTE